MCIRDSGKIDLNTSWDLVRRGIGDSKLRLARKWDQEMSSGDIWLKGTNLGAFPLWLDNFSVESRQIKLSSTQTWLRSQSSSLNISPIGQRDTVVYGLGQLEPGFHSAEILADDASTLGVDGRTVVSVCLPERLTEGANGSFSLSLTSGDSVVRRFIDVPESVESLELSLKGTGSGSRFVIYNPEGLLVQEGFLEDQRTVCVGLPKDGLWQICFFRDVQDQLAGGFSANVNVKFQGVCVRDLGVTGDVQTFSVESDSSVPVRFNFIGPDRGSEWRDRRSIYIPVGESSVIYLPDIEEGTESVSVRFGTTDESVLRGTPVSYTHLEIQTSLYGLICNLGVGLFGKVSRRRESVSYTHLDVYKRQIIGWRLHKSWNRNKAAALCVLSKCCY